MEIEAVESREAAHFLPVVKRLPVAVVEGSGARLTDVAGKSYIDLTAGWGVTCIGHCHPALVEAISDQAGRLMQTTNIFYNFPQLDLIERLAAVTPPPRPRWRRRCSVSWVFAQEHRFSFSKVVRGDIFFFLLRIEF